MKYFFVLLLISNQAFCQTAIDKSEVILVGGIKQFVRIKGKDSSKPLLLFLHGGPGGSVMNKAELMTGKLQQHFVVVHWDQRETGATLQLNKLNSPLTLDLFYNDTHDLIDTLLRRFHQPKLYLAGYSWGTVLGFYIAAKYPGLLYAYLAISPVINQWKSEQVALDMLRSKMGKKAVKELAGVKIPFENGEQLFYHRKWLFKSAPQKMVRLALPKNFFASWAATWFSTWKEACSINLFESLPKVDCPVYFFAGEDDYQTNYSITRDYFDVISAPVKDFFSFPHTGHTIPETDPVELQDIIIEKILPVTYKP
jgi:pimeloyl-ACP methyl ester carboxylesterase